MYPTIGMKQNTVTATTVMPTNSPTSPGFEPRLSECNGKTLNKNTRIKLDYDYVQTVSDRFFYDLFKTTSPSLEDFIRISSLVETLSCLFWSLFAPFLLWVHQHGMISPLSCGPFLWPTLPHFTSL